MKDQNGTFELYSKRKRDNGRRKDTTNHEKKSLGRASPRFAAQKLLGKTPDGYRPRRKED